MRCVPYPETPHCPGKNMAGQSQSSETRPSMFKLSGAKLGPEANSGFHVWSLAGVGVI